MVGFASVVALPAAASAAPPPWHAQNSGVLATLKGIEFSDSWHGWAVGEPNGVGVRAPIVATRIGGKTWVKQNSHMLDTTPNGADFVDSTHGWAVGEPFTDVSFPTANRVAVTAEADQNVDGSPFQVLVSSNGGAVLYPQSSGSSLTLNSVACPRGSASGWASGENGTIQSSNPYAGAGC